jgi:hypothetical protein
MSVEAALRFCRTPEETSHLPSRFGEDCLKPPTPSTNQSFTDGQSVRDNEIAKAVVGMWRSSTVSQIKSRADLRGGAAFVCGSSSWHFLY